MEMRLEGKTQKEIGRTLGLTRTGVFRAVEAALKRTLNPPAEKLRALELAKLDVMERALWRRVETGDEEAIDRTLRIAKRRAELLGLDAPARMEHSGELGIRGEMKVDHNYDGLKEQLKDPTFRALAGRFIRGLGAASS
jgi:hypothetical protein